MNILPLDVIPIIFSYINKITDKRQFSKTCVMYNNITKNMIKMCEYDFPIKRIDHVEEYSMEKFTLELCYDEYYDMIPTKYLIPNNTIIVEVLAKFGQVELLQIAKNNRCRIHLMVSLWAAEYGHINVIELSLQAQKISQTITPISISMIAKTAAQYGQLDVLKWLVTYVDEIPSDMGTFVATYAACGGNLDILIWLKEKGYVYNKSFVRQMVDLNGYVNIIEWLDANE